MREVGIRGEMIRLGQLLKLAGVRDTGGEVKELLAERAVAVNGELETRRGRQLRPGDVIRVGADEIRLVGDRASPALSGGAPAHEQPDPESREPE